MLLRAPEHELFQRGGGDMEEGSGSRKRERGGERWEGREEGEKETKEEEEEGSMETSGVWNQTHSPSRKQAQHFTTGSET